MADKHRMTFSCYGNVRPASVVKLSNQGDFTVAQAGSSDVPFGIAQEWAKGAQGTPFASDYAGTNTDAIEVYAPGGVAVAAVKRTAPSIQAGNSVGPDADGAIQTINTGWAVGWLLESGTASTPERLRVFVFPHYRPSGSQS